MGHSLVQRAGDVHRVPAIGPRLCDQGQHSDAHLRLGALDPPSTEVRHPDEARLEGVSAAGRREHLFSRLVHRRGVDMITYAVFFFFAAVAVIFALVVILHRNPVVSALSLVASFFALAVMYVLLEAPFLAALQVIVYAGAIMVLFLFVIMLLNLQHVG